MQCHAIPSLSGDDNGWAVAMRTGADGLLAKPLSSVAYCQKAILELLLEDPGLSHAIT